MIVFPTRKSIDTLAVGSIAEAVAIPLKPLVEIGADDGSTAFAWRQVDAYVAEIARLDSEIETTRDPGEIARLRGLRLAAVRQLNGWRAKKASPGSFERAVPVAEGPSCDTCKHVVRTRALYSQADVWLCSGFHFGAWGEGDPLEQRFPTLSEARSDESLCGAMGDYHEPETEMGRALREADWAARTRA